MMIRIILAGLVAFVPSADNKEMCVLLVDARVPIIVDGEEVAAHYPTIRVEERFLQDVSCRSSSEIYRTPDRCVSDGTGTFALYFLDDEELTLNPTRSDETPDEPYTLPPEQKPNPTKPCCHDPSICGPFLPCGSAKAAPFHNQRQDYSWIPSLGEIVERAGSADGDCFESEPPEGLVVARLRLPPGRLHSYLLEGESDPHNNDPLIIAEIDFTPAGTEPDFAPRALPRMVALEIETAVAPELVIRSRNLFTGNVEQRSILLKDSTELELMIVNLPWQALADPYAHGPGPGLHFAHYYRLADDHVPASLQRYPFQVNPVPGGDLLCPPVQMNR